jgi:hypothetical protein
MGVGVDVVVVSVESNIRSSDGRVRNIGGGGNGKGGIDVHGGNSDFTIFVLLSDVFCIGCINNDLC